MLRRYFPSIPGKHGVWGKSSFPWEKEGQGRSSPLFMDLGVEVGGVHTVTLSPHSDPYLSDAPRPTGFLLKCCTPQPSRFTASSQFSRLLFPQPGITALPSHPCPPPPAHQTPTWLTHSSISPLLRCHHFWELPESELDAHQALTPRPASSTAIFHDLFTFCMHQLAPLGRKVVSLILHWSPPLSSISDTLFKDLNG